jgi:hypothetical protein
VSLLERERAHLDKGVDGKDDELGLGFGVVHEVEVDELLLFEAESARAEPSAVLWVQDPAW